MLRPAPMADFTLMPPLQPEDPRKGNNLLLMGGIFLLVFALYSRFFLPQPPPPVVQASLPGATPPGPTAAVAPPPAPQILERKVVLEGGALGVKVTNRGAGIFELTCLKNAESSVLYDAPLYTASPDLPRMPALLATVVTGDRLLGWQDVWSMEEVPDGRSIRFTCDLGGGISLVKTLRMPEKGYLVTGEVEVLHAGSVPVTLLLETLVPPPGDGTATTGILQQAECFLQRSPSDKPRHKIRSASDVIGKDLPWSPSEEGQQDFGWPARWSGMTSSYFAAVVDLEGAAIKAWPVHKSEAIPPAKDPAVDQAVLSLTAPSWTLAPGERRTLAFRAFVGPKQKAALATVDPILPTLMDKHDWLDFLNYIESGIKSILDLLYRLAGNYGLAIILLTLLVRGAIHPLNRMAQSSMMISGEKMKRLQPKLAELKKRLKNTPEKLFKEQGRLMKEEGMSPFSTLGGCLPILLQMPVLWALYGVLQSAVELRGAPFLLWIRDLAKEDAVTSGIPLLHTLNPLPILLIGVMLYQMWKAPKPADPQMAQQQKMMMFIMPVMFGWMMYHLPSGITLYWLTSTTFSIGEQKYIRARLIRLGLVKPEPVPVKP